MLKQVGFLGFIITLLFVSPSFTSAQSSDVLLSQNNTLEIATEESATDSAEIDTDITVSYELPYPGMLPDNPLYFLKTMRDAVVKFLISDTMKKAEFSLLTSDKRLFASVFLIEKEKDELAFETLTKSTNYLHDAVRYLKQAQERGNESSDAFRNTLENAVKKHIEVVSRQIEPHIAVEYRDRLETEKERLATIEKEVAELRTE